MLGALTKSEQLLARPESFDTALCLSYTAFGASTDEVVHLTCGDVSLLRMKKWRID